MAAAMMLADDGHDVTVFERDAESSPAEPGEAFTEWNRRGVAQFSLAHWLHARGTAVLRDHVPAAYQLLDDNGGYHFNLVEAVLGPDACEPDDARFDLLTGRRSTLEWAMATAADNHPGVTVQRGDAVSGLISQGRSGDTSVPRVTGVRLASGAEHVGDLVIDATGRKSPTPKWLDEIGAVAPVEHSEDSGFSYTGRYYRARPGERPDATRMPMLAPYGSFSILTLPADADTWSVTLYGLSDDRPLRKWRDPDVFERVVRACPPQASWVEGEPISDISTMAGVVDRHREFVVDGTPCATGILSIADASSCTNPSLGRGITLGLMHAEVMRSCVRDHLDDLDALAMSFHERTTEQVLPFHDSTTKIDRRRVDEMRIYRDGGTPERTDEQKFADVLGAAVGRDATATRLYGEIFSCLATPDQIFARPGVFEHVLGLAATVTPEPLPGPTRSELLELVG